MKAMWTVLLVLAVCASAFALAPAKMSYQGVLTNATGVVVADGNYDLDLSLYDAAEGGTALWTEEQTAAVAGGVFNVVLGAVAPLALPFDKPYYLGVAVNDGAELAPRTLLTSAAYSLNAPVMVHGGSGATTDLGVGVWTNYEGDSVTIACPGPGYVVVMSSAWMQIFHAANVADRIYVGHATTITGQPTSFMYVAASAVPATGAVGTYDVSLPVQTVFPISAAGTYTFFLNGQQATGTTSNTRFWYASTVATWYPGTPPEPDFSRTAEPMKSMPVGR